MKQILILRPDKAGDALKTLRPLRAALSLFPETRFSILCSSHNASLFAFENHVRVFELPKDWELIPHEQLLQCLKQLPFPTQFDIAINPLCDIFPHVDRLLECIPAKARFSRSLGLRLLGENAVETPEESNIAHLLGQALNVDLLSVLVNQSKVPAISPLDYEEAFRSLGTKFQKRLGLCPLAGLAQRSHSLRRWKRFTKILVRASQPTEIYLLGGKANREELEYLRDGSPDIEILYPSSFRSLAAYLATMDGIVAVDSGPLHLAQALQVPSLGILSGGDFRRWFSSLNEKDHLLPRGLFTRRPILLEMVYAFKRWYPEVTP